MRPLLIKLSYAVPTVHGGAISPVTLLFLRMAIALPFFAAIALWLRGRGALVIFGVLLVSLRGAPPALLAR